MAINFPLNPSLNTTYVAPTGVTYRYNGYAWDIEEFQGNVIPSADLEFTLGNITHQWKDIFVGNSIALNNSILTVNDTGILLVNGLGTGENFYGNANVASYLPTDSLIQSLMNGENFYGNANVASYLPTDSLIQSLINAENFYGNANVASYLPTYSGDIAVGNIVVANSLLFSDNTVQTTAYTGYNDANVASYLSTATSVNIAGAIISNGNLTTTGNATFGNITATNVYLDRGSDATDWNTLTVMGVYLINRSSWSGTINTPINSQNFNGQLEVINTGNVSITQNYRPYDATYGQDVYWTRSIYSTNSWTSWVEIINGAETVDGGSF